MSNIQVVVRCRARNGREKLAKSPIVVELPSETFSIADPYVTVDNGRSTHTVNNIKTYKLDQVYGSEADQRLLFDKVAMPLFNDFLDGLNTTILAYGQTGTGKTYTMCGGEPNVVDFDNDTIGIIPRVLMELFRRLSDDYVVKCSYLELYNEELRDLLAEDDSKSRLRIYESQGKKLKNIVVQNLCEEHVLTCQGGLNVLKRGLLKRKTASTKLNDVSSRSHTIFTISLYRKQPGEGVGSDLFRVSKMNLVDLAGSENISRSGAINQRAKEAGSINQSLLTLGRVINSLSEPLENTSHIPYRESKLTRLLQDSIGGNTKTTLIATISPAKVSIDETTSTLDYASKAKNIKNIPQSGQDSDMIMKKVLVKNLSQELVRLNSDLIATRNKNGIWMNTENYNTMMEENEALKANIKELTVKNKSLASKVTDLELYKINTASELSGIKTEFNDMKSINSQLELAIHDSKQQLQRKDQDLTKLNAKFKHINDKYNTKTARIVKVVYENMNMSLDSIQTILNKYNNNKNCDNISVFNNQLLHDVSRFKNRISEKLGTIGKISDSLDELPQFLLQYNDNFSQLSDIVTGLNSKMASNLDELRDLNGKLTSYIMEEHLDEAKCKVKLNKIVEERIAKELTQMNEALSHDIHSVLATSKRKYESLFETSVAEISTQLISDQRSELQDRQNTWGQESTKVLENIDTDLQNTSQESLREKATALNIKTNDKLSLLNRSSRASLRELSHLVETESIDTKLLSDVKHSVAENDADIRRHLLAINKNLRELQKETKENSDSPQRAETSPSRNEPLPLGSSGPSPARASPTKTTRSPIKSRIPQLNKSLENKENSESVKRRKLGERVELLRQHTN